MNKNIPFLLPVLFLLFFGCSNDDAPIEDLKEYEKAPILSTNLPEELTAGQIFNLRITYARPTRCHRFSELQIEELKDEFYFSVIMTFNRGQECEREDLTSTTSFEFVPEPVEFYIFKFWQGRNEQGEDVYLTVQVPVKTNST